MIIASLQTIKDGSMTMNEDNYGDIKNIKEKISIGSKDTVRNIYTRSDDVFFLVYLNKNRNIKEGH